MDGLVRIPSSCAARCDGTYVKLITSVRLRPRHGWWFDGVLLGPGRRIREADLWPDASYPRPALLLEYAGNPKPARGWGRHKQDNEYILWTYTEGDGEFRELARTMLPPGTWSWHMGPLAQRFLERGGYGQRYKTVEEIQQRVSDFLDAELEMARPEDEATVLAVLYDQIACRICGPLRWAA